MNSDLVSVKTASTEGVATASLTLTDWWAAGEQQTGDFFILEGTNDGGGTALGIDVGWTELHGPAPSNGACRTGVWWIRHTGTAIAAPTLTGANDEWAVVVQKWRGINQTTAIDSSQVTEITANTQSFVAPSATTTVQNTVVLRILGGDGSGTSLPSTGWGSAVSGGRTTDNTTSATLNAESVIDWHVQPTAGATGTYAWDRSVSDSGRTLTVCLRLAAGAAVPAYPRGAPNYTVTSLAVSPTINLLSTWHSTILGKTVRDGSTTGGAIRNTLAAQSTALVSNGLYGWTRDIGQTQTANTGLTGIYGAAFQLPAPTDFTTGLFLTWLQFPATSGTASNDGPLLYFRDTSGNWAAIRPYTESVAASDSFRPFLSYLPDEVQVDGNGLVNWSQVEWCGDAIDAVTTVTTATQRSATWRGVYRVPVSGGAVPIVGGTPSVPFSFRDVADIVLGGVAYRTPSIQGSKQQLFFGPFQIGDGTVETHFNGNATAAEFADLTFRGLRCRSGDLEARLKLSSADSFALGAASIGSGLRQRVVVDSASSTAADYAFNGTIFGSDVELKTGVPCVGATFSACSKIVAHGADVEGCTITGTVSTDAAIGFDANASLAETTIDLTGTSAAHHVELGTGVTTFDLTDVVLSGAPGTSNIKVLRTTGTVTITLALGQTTPTHTSSGATVVFAQPQALAQVSNLVAGSMVEVFNVTTPSMVHRNIVSGALWSLSYDDGTTFSNGDTVRVRVTNVYGTNAYEPEEYTTIATVSGWTVSASQSTTKTQAAAYNTWGLNGPAITKFAQDNGNIDIDINSGTTGQKKEVAAWWMAQLMTVSGIRDFWNAYTIEGVASIRQNVSEVDVLLQNTQPGTSFRFTDNDVRYYRSDYSSPYDTTPGFGSVFMDYAGVPLTVNVGSGLTAPQAATLAKIDTLTEDVSGLRFKAKALETAPSGGGSAPTVVQIRQEMDASSTKLALLDAAITTRLAAAVYTAPLDATATQFASAAAIAAYDPPTKAELDAGIAGIPAAPSASTNAAAVRTEIATELARIDVAVSTRNATAPLDATATQAAAAAALTSYDAATGADVAGIPAAPTAAAVAAQVRTELATELARLDVAISTAADPTEVQAAALAALVAYDAATGSDVAGLPSAAAIAAALGTREILTGWTYDRALRVAAALAAAKTSGMATGQAGTSIVRDLDDSRDLITAVQDANGNRQSVTVAP